MERWDRVGWRGGVGCRLERLDRVHCIGRVVVQGVYRCTVLVEWWYRVYIDALYSIGRVVVQGVYRCSEGG